MSVDFISESKCFDGKLGFYRHPSSSCNCEMRFAVYQPPQASHEQVMEADQPLNLRYQEGYDHSYYFIASFIEDHIRHHAIALIQ